MKKYLYFVVLVGFLFEVQSVQAWDGVEVRAKVVRLDIQNNGDIFVVLANNLVLCPTAGAGSNHIGVISTSIPGAIVTSEGLTRMLSVLLSAYMSDRPISIWANNNGTAFACKVGLIRL